MRFKGQLKIAKQAVLSLQRRSAESCSFHSCIRMTCTNREEGCIWDADILPPYMHVESCIWDADILPPYMHVHFIELVMNTMIKLIHSRPLFGTKQ